MSKKEVNPIDEKSIQRILSGFHPQFLSFAIGWYNYVRGQLTGRAIMRAASVLRTYVEQNKLYAKGRTEPGRKVTNAKGGESWHNFGLAIDFVLLKDTDDNGSFDAASWQSDVDFDGDGKADWLEVADCAKMFFFEWGGDWKSFVDLPHIQLIPIHKNSGEKLTLAECRKRYNDKHFIKGTNFIDLSDYHIVTS